MFIKIEENIMAQNLSKIRGNYHSYSPNLLTMVGNLAEGTTRYLGDKVGGTDKFQDFVHVSWKKDVFVGFWEL